MDEQACGFRLSMLLVIIYAANRTRNVRRFACLASSSEHHVNSLRLDASPGTGLVSVVKPCDRCNRPSD